MQEAKQSMDNLDISMPSPTQDILRVREDEFKPVSSNSSNPVIPATQLKQLEQNY